VNDTIVMFDRIREVRGKNPAMTEEMIDISVNQTLSRTILTAWTVWIVVVVLYFLGGPGIHGFAFSLVIGVIVGTYSSIYISCPFLLYMFNRKNKAAKPKSESQPAKAAAG
jgi:SecD/SecF fusion protein